MGKVIIRLSFALALLLTINMQAKAAWRVVIDPWSVAQVGANTAAQKLIEEQHNKRIDSIYSRKQRMMQYTAAMATIKELYRSTMQNVLGFGEETAYYREIFLCAADIFKDIPTVTKAIMRKPGKNYILCLNELANVGIETEGLIHDFIEIVNNGKVKLPDTPIIKDKIPSGGGRFNMGTNDGYNLLDRYERLTLANRIYSRLLNLRYKMELMVMMSQFGTWGDVLFAIDPQSWAAYFTGRNLVGSIVADWNGLSV